MRLGARRTVLQTINCITAKLYQKERHIDERHRHRYEVNPEMVPRLEEAGLIFVGKDETGERCEVIELDGHPFFMGTQAHPEFKSRPGKPSPPFLGFVLAAAKRLDAYLTSRTTPMPSPAATPVKPAVGGAAAAGAAGTAAGGGGGGGAAAAAAAAAALVDRVNIGGNGGAAPAAQQALFKSG